LVSLSDKYRLPPSTRNSRELFDFSTCARDLAPSIPMVLAAVQHKELGTQENILQTTTNEH